MSTLVEPEKNEFAAWLSMMGRGHRPLSDRRAALALGLSRKTVKSYREGARLPRHLRLTMAAVAFGLPAWRALE